MKFGVRECANVVFRAKQVTKIGNATFQIGQPVLYLDTATTSTVEGSSTTVYAQGGRGNARLMAWEGDRALTFTVEDALISPIGLNILAGAGIWKGKTGVDPTYVHFHTTSNATLQYATSPLTGATGSIWQIDLSEVIPTFGTDAKICVGDAPIYIMGTETDGSLTGEIFQDAIKIPEESELATAYKSKAGKMILFPDLNGSAAGPVSSITNSRIQAATSVMVDYYIDKLGTKVTEIQIAADTFGGYYYVEADTLFRRQSDGVDVPANLTFPNVKIQSNFSFTLSSTGDPSTFTFTMDAFPGYTYFDKTRQVMCVIQTLDDAGTTDGATAATVNPVMPHTSAVEHPEVMANDSQTDQTLNNGTSNNTNDSQG